MKLHLPELSDLEAKFFHDPVKLEENKPRDYPTTIVDHKLAREKAIEIFKKLR